MGKEYCALLQDEYGDEEVENISAVSAVREAMRLRAACPNIRFNKLGFGGADRSEPQREVHLVHACPLRDSRGEKPLFICVHCDVTRDDAFINSTTKAQRHSGRAGSPTMPSAGADGLPHYLASAAMLRRTEARKSAMAVLEDRAARYSDDHALILCRVYDFAAGLLFLLEKLNFFNDILEYNMQYNEHQAIISHCQKHGAKDPNLWVQALAYFTDSARVMQCGAELKQVLDFIERGDLLSALQVIDILSRAADCPVGVVQEYLVRTFSKLTEDTAEHERVIDTCATETKRLRALTDSKTCTVTGAEAEKGAPPAPATTRHTHATHAPTSAQRARLPHHAHLVPAHMASSPERVLQRNVARAGGRSRAHAHAHAPPTAVANVMDTLTDKQRPEVLHEEFQKQLGGADEARHSQNPPFFCFCASRSVRRPLLTLLVNPGSRDRCGESD